MSSYSILARAKKLPLTAFLLPIALAPAIYAQPDSVTFNVNETLPHNPDPGYTVTKQGASVVVTSGGATVTFSAPSGEFTGKELQNSVGSGPGFFLDKPATFTVSATFADPDDVIVVVLNGLGNGGAAVACSTSLTPKKPSTTCAYQSFPITTPSDRDEKGDYPRLLQQSFRVDFNSGTGPSALVYVEYDYDNGNTCPATSGNSTFAPRAATTCDDLAIDSIQIVQVMQEQENRVKLIQGKDTWARVFVKSVGPGKKTLTSITGKLTANGTVLSADRGEVVAERDVSTASRRLGSSLLEATYRNNSFDFYLGPLQGTEIDLFAAVFIVDSKGNPVLEGSTDNNQMSLNLKLDPPGTPNPLRVGLGYVCTNNSGTIACPVHFSELDIDPAFPVQHTLPVQILLPKLTFDQKLLASGDADSRSLVTLIMIKEYLHASKLAQTFQYFSYPEPDQVVFILGGSAPNADENFGEPGGIFGRYWWVTQGCQGGDLPCIDSPAIAHGIAHNYGLGHITDIANPYASFAFETARTGGSFGNRGQWNYNYNRLMEVPTQPKFANGEQLAVGGGEYNALHSAFLKNVTSGHARPAASTSEIAVISGTVSADGSSGTLDPAFHGSAVSAADSSDPGGDTCLRFTPAGAGSDFCFKPLVANGASKGYFAVAAPFPTGTTRVGLMRNGRELASLSSGVTPQIAFTAPVSGQSWQGTQTLRWSATGATNATYRLEYSPDNGTSWLPLSTDLSTTQYDFDTGDILGGSILFRVTASTGLTNVSALSPPVQIVQNSQQSLSATTMTFNNVQIGGSDKQRITVTNSGSGQLLVKIVPPTNSAFQLLIDPMFTVAAGTSMTIPVQFTPGTAGQQQATLKVGNQDVTLRGGGFATIVPNIQIASPVDLGDVQAGQKKDATFTIANTGGDALNVTAISISGAAFSLANPGTPVTIASGSSAAFTVHVSAGAVGTLSGQISVTSNDPTRGQLVTPVSARVNAAASPLVTTPDAVLNAAGYEGGAVAPGEIIVIYGSNLGPVNLAGLQLDANGFVANKLSETRVFFDEFPAPLVYTSAGVVSVIVPYGVAGRSVVQLTVQYQGRRSDPLFIPVRDTIPALFSANATGTGQGAILNPDYSPNSAQNPAQKGSYVILYGTGEGSTSPNVLDGSVIAGVVQPLLPVTVTIGNVPQKVLYAGSAPGLVAGVLQVNVGIASNTPSGNQPVVVTVGTVSSQSGLTVAIAGGASVPAISLSSSALDFGSVLLAQTKDLTFSISNNGNAPLNVSSILSSNARFTVTQPATPFIVNPGLSQTVTVRFSPAAAGTQTGSLTVSSNDTAKAAVSVSLTGNGTSATVPSIALSPTSLDFGSISSGQTKDLTFSISNNGNAPLNVSSILSSNARFTVTQPATPFIVNPGLSQTVTVRFSPSAAGTQTGSLTISSNDPARAAVSVSITGSGTSPVTVYVSDSFNRANSTACSLGQADLALGGTGAHFYLPVFPGTSGPIGASIVSGALQNNGLDFGGVQLTASAAACINSSVKGESLQQDLNISVDLVVPKTGANITEAGPYFRSRAAAAGDGIIGGASAGYWVALVSTGEVRVLGLNPNATIASSGPVAGFDAGAKHTLQMAIQSSTLQVSLDGKLVNFAQSGSTVTTLALPVTLGTNNGAVGIAFGAPDNRGAAGGQRATNLLVTAYHALQ